MSAEERASAAHVDADRKVRDAYALLGRICAELIRRDVATDLVPAWLVGQGVDVEARQRGTWPHGLSDTARIEELEELVRSAQAREDEAVRRLRTAEVSLSIWHRRAKDAEAGRTPPAHLESEIVASLREARDAAESRWQVERDRATALAETVRVLGDFAATLRVLPMQVGRMHPDHVAVLSEELDPRRRTAALSPADQSALRARAVALWRQAREAHGRAGGV